MKNINELQELLYGAEPELQKEMLELWVEELIDEIKCSIIDWKIAQGGFYRITELMDQVDNIEKQLRDDKDSR